MTNRADMLPDGTGWRRLSYTCKCGWIDWGHASPGNASKLKAGLISEESFPAFANWKNVKVEIDNGSQRMPAFLLPFEESMIKVNLGFDNARITYGGVWAVKKGLTMQQREQVAWSIFVATSFGFEKMQGAFPFSLGSASSSFSGEDLVSNLIGFYRAFRLGHTKNTSSASMRQWCGEVSVEESLRIWDRFLPSGGIGALKNKTFDPLRFQTDACKGKDCSFPAELKTIQMAPYGQWFVRLKAPHYSTVMNQMKRDSLNIIDRNGSIKVIQSPSPYAQAVQR